MFLLLLNRILNKKFKQNKIRNVKVGRTFFFSSHCTTRQVSFLAQAVLNCNLFWKIFHDKQDYRSMNKSHLFYQSKYIFWWTMHAFRCLLGTLYTLYNRVYIYIHALIPGLGDLWCPFQFCIHGIPLMSLLHPLRKVWKRSSCYSHFLFVL